MTLTAARPSWSRSRVFLLRECKRKYFFQRAKPAARDDSPVPWELIHHLRQLSNRFLWSGAVVHDTIGGLLKSLRQGQPIPSLEETRQGVQLRMREEFRSSLNDPRRSGRLFEHEYNVMIPKEKWQSQWDIVESALNLFFHSAWLDRLSKLEPECWKAVDELLEFDVSGVLTYVKIDCAIEKESTFTLMDWKTSSLKFNDQESLRVAALYAHEVWGAEPDRINAIAVSLIDGDSQKVGIDEGVLQDTKSKIMQDASVLEVQDQSFPSDPFSIACTSSLETCDRCNFQKICHPKGVGLAV